MCLKIMQSLFLPAALMLLMISIAGSEEVSERSQLNLDLDKLAREAGIYQEYVEVSSESYRGLDLKLITPAEWMSGYKPHKVKWTPYTDKLLYPTYELDLSGFARYKSGKVFDVSIPTD